MAEESNYWKRLARKRLSRRRLLVGAMGVGAGLTAASLVGCQGDDEEPVATGTPAGTATATPTAQQRPGEPAPDVDSSFYNPTPLEPVKEGSRGGIVRYYNYDALPPDSFDPHQTQFGPVYGMHSAVFSKVLQYENIPSGTIATDLAESIPEVVDETKYVIKIRPGVRFHDTERARKYPGLAGRELTGEDVKYMIERQANPDSPKAGRYYRKSQWDTVDKVEVGP